MSKKTTPTYCLVIDADVAQAAGSLDATSAVAIACRDVLVTVMGVCHRIAWTPPIQAEWDVHASKSGFASTWFVKMFRLGKVRAVYPSGSELADGIDACDASAEVKVILHKDRHLVEASLAGDARLISRNTAARTHFTALAATLTALKPILWVNPDTTADIIDWLEAGAPDEKHRRLRRR